jgi:hypothetical protein
MMTRVREFSCGHVRNDRHQLNEHQEHGDHHSIPRDGVTFLQTKHRYQEDERTSADRYARAHLKIPDIT